MIGTALCDHHTSPQIPVTPQSGKWIKARSGMVQGSSSDKLMLRLYSKPAQPQVFRLAEPLVTQMKVDGDPMKGSRRIWLWWDASRSARETGLSHSESKPRNNQGRRHLNPEDPSSCTDSSSSNNLFWWRKCPAWSWSQRGSCVHHASWLRTRSERPQKSQKSIWQWIILNQDCKTYIACHTLQTPADQQ